jgi:hypothetical protein
MKRVLLVEGDYAFHERSSLAQNPLIDLKQLGGGQQAGLRVEVIQIAQCIPEGIADLAVSLGQPLQDGLGERNVLSKLH